MPPISTANEGSRHRLYTPIEYIPIRNPKNPTIVGGCIVSVANDP